MNKYILFAFLFFTLVTIKAHGQTCKHRKLSNSLDFQTNINRIKLDKAFDSCIVTIKVSNKVTKEIVQTVRFTSNFLFDSSYVHCDNERSYTTGINKNAEVADNDYGDIIVADFNFDNKEDFAIKTEEGGNGGPLYSYYIQTGDTTFKLDKFLSETMVYFPTHFNKTKQTLTTLVHANAYQMSETVYKFDTLANKWEKATHQLLGEIKTTKK